MIFGPDRDEAAGGWREPMRSFMTCTLPVHQIKEDERDI